MLGVGVVGIGLIGRRRAEVAKQDRSADPIIISDVNQHKAENLAQELECEVASEWEAIVTREDVDVVIISTPPDMHLAISLAAFSAGKHVLCEKPLGRNPEEARRIVEAARERGVKLKAGLNCRHHRNVHKARDLVTHGAIGDILFIRSRYGHGGRPGYENEWRANPQIAGGGELTDQGVHILDLFRWFLGNFEEVVGFTATSFWNIPTEDNAFALLRTAEGQVASLHASWTQWKNLFSFEIFGRDGYLIVEGLGESYGLERLIWGKRLFQSGPPEEKHFKFPGPDVSWEEEWREFVTAIRENREPLGNGYDGWQALRLAYAIYESAMTGHIVKLTDDG